jgi:tetratricopeptide (TPR) repeat protein
MSKQKKTSITLQSPPENNQISIKFIRLFLIITVLLVYGNSLKFSFTLDDDIFYLKHKSVQEGVSNIGNFFSKGSMMEYDGTIGSQPYRPLTLSFFALQKTLFDNSPIAAHFLCVLLYILVILVLHKLLSRLFSGLHPYVIGLICMLFVVHPLHTEVVASVKSSDELLAALFGFMAWNSFLDISDHKKLSEFIPGILFMFLALLCKESAISFLVIIPLSLYMIRKETIKESSIKFFALLLPVIIFLGMRYNANGAWGAPSTGKIIDNVLYGAQSFSELTATKSEILFYYLRLMLWPWPLNCDYSYNQVSMVGWNNFYAISGLVTYALLLVTSLVFLKKKSLISFCILFFFITTAPTNNLFFINGATIGERFLFVPSLAICILIPWLLSMLMHLDLNTLSLTSKNAFIGILAFLILIFGGLSYSRTQDWKDNISLFQKAVEQSPKSARSHYYLGSMYMNSSSETQDKLESEKFITNAIEEFNKTLDIYPTYPQALYNSGLCYVQVKDSVMAIERYRRTIDADATSIPAINNLGVIYNSKGKLDSAKYYFEMAYKLDPTAKNSKANISAIYLYIGINYQNKAEVDSAILFYRQSLAFDDKNIYAINNLSSLLIGKSQLDSALFYLQKGYAIDNRSVMILESLGTSYFMQKKYNDAITFSKKAFELQPRSKRALGIIKDSYNALGNQAEADKYAQLFESIR